MVLRVYLIVVVDVVLLLLLLLHVIVVRGGVIIIVEAEVNVVAAAHQHVFGRQEVSVDVQVVAHQYRA